MSNDARSPNNHFLLYMVKIGLNDNDSRFSQTPGVWRTFVSFLAENDIIFTIHQSIYFNTLVMDRHFSNRPAGRKLFHDGTPD